MFIKEYSVREVQDILSRNGFTYLRTHGSHRIYSNGNCSVSIPSQKKTVNKMLFLRIIKENNLMLN